jgi:hypothetical protein
MSLTALQKLALSNIELSKEERKKIAPGKHNVSFTVTVDGTLDVAANESYTPTVDIPLIPSMALALKKMGVQREHFLGVLKDAMVEVLAADKTMREAMIKEVGLADFESDFRKTLGTLPKRTRVGKVKASLNIIPE